MRYKRITDPRQLIDCPGCDREVRIDEVEEPGHCPDCMPAPAASPAPAPAPAPAGEATPEVVHESEIADIFGDARRAEVA